MNSVSTLNPGAALRISDAVLGRVRELRREQGNATLKLRVAVDGGGCSGFRYGFTLEPLAAAGDTVLERDGVEVLVDPLSLQYLAGAEVDYVEALAGAQFVVRNPNATATCGCGNSFAA